MQQKASSGSRNFFSNTQPKAILYKSFKDFTHFVPLGGGDDDGVDYVPVPSVRGDGQPDKFTALSKDFVAPNPNYDDTWFILMRQGEYGAQIEKLAADLYGFFLGYGTQIDIVKEADSYYAASRKIKNFLEMRSAWQNFTVSEDGILLYTEGEKTLPIINFGKLDAITEFFADTDCQNSNFGIQTYEGCYRAFKIDNEHTFSFQHQAEAEGQATIKDSMDMYLALKGINISSIILAEKEAMLKTIAETDFSIIEKIIRATLTANQLTYARETLISLINSSSVDAQDEESPSMSIAELQQQLEALEVADPAEYGVEKILITLRDRHQQLQARILDPGKGSGLTN